MGVDEAEMGFTLKDGVEEDPSSSMAKTDCRAILTDEVSVGESRWRGRGLGRGLLRIGELLTVTTGGLWRTTGVVTAGSMTGTA